MNNRRVLMEERGKMLRDFLSKQEPHELLTFLHAFWDFGVLVELLPEYEV